MGCGATQGIVQKSKRAALSKREGLCVRSSPAQISFDPNETRFPEIDSTKTSTRGSDFSHCVLGELGEQRQNMPQKQQQRSFNSLCFLERVKLSTDLISPHTLDVIFV